jgi:hypothetical protein
MTHYTASTVHDGWVLCTLCRLRTAVQPYIIAILAAVDAHACRMPPEHEAKVMCAIKEAAWR